MTRVSCAVLIAALAVGCAACASPEASRVRGQGHGGDVGNVGAGVAAMHEGSDPYWRTPRRTGVASGPLDTARQADRLSR